MRAFKSLKTGVRDPTPLAIVDAFSDGPFTGNPAGVCVLATPAPERSMASVAAEVGASETAFLSPGDDGWRLAGSRPRSRSTCAGTGRWRARVCCSEAGTVRFRTRSGLLHASNLESSENALDFPRVATREAAADPAIAAALGQTPS